MINIPAEPKPGDRISANFIGALIRCIRALRPLQGPGIKLAEGPNGTTISIAADDRPKKRHHRPFEVAGSDEDDYKFAIYVPDNVVSIGEEIVTPTGITAISGADDWYSLDDEDDVDDSGSTLFLIAYDDKSAEFTFDLDGAVNAAGSSSSEKKIVAVLAIAELMTQTLGENTVGVVKRQLACHPFTAGKGGGGTLTASGTVVTGVDYVTSTGDPDYSAHAYSIRITRGRLTYNAAAGALTVVDDPALKQFIATTPHSVSMDYQS